jgi:hypothetical protein
MSVPTGFWFLWLITTERQPLTSHSRQNMSNSLARPSICRRHVTTWSTGFLEKLTVPHLLNKFPRRHCMFVTFSTTAGWFSISSEMNTIDAFETYLHFNIIIPSTPPSSTRYCTFRFPHQVVQAILIFGTVYYTLLLINWSTYFSNSVHQKFVTVKHRLKHLLYS